MHANSNHARGKRYVLRKKPSGTIISPVAHQVDREFRVLKALGSVKGFPVPKVFVLCMDPEVIGTAFYVWSLALHKLRAAADSGCCTDHGIHQRADHYRHQSRTTISFRQAESVRSKGISRDTIN